jgi:hypothetical protein
MRHHPYSPLAKYYKLGVSVGHDTLKFISLLAVLAAMVLALSLYAAGHFPALGPGRSPVVSPAPFSAHGISRHVTAASPRPSATGNMAAGRQMPQNFNYRPPVSYVAPPTIQLPGNGYMPVQQTGYQAQPAPSTGLAPSVAPIAVEEKAPGTSFLSGWESMIEQAFQFLALLFHGNSSFLQEWSRLFKT